MNFILAVQTLTDAEVEFAIIGEWSPIMPISAHLTKRSRFVLFTNFCQSAAAGDGPRSVSSSSGRIDLLAEVTGLANWDDVRKGCVRLPAFGREVWTLDLPSLIQAKRAARRPKDLLVLPELESLLNAAANPEELGNPQ